MVDDALVFCKNQTSHNVFLVKYFISPFGAWWGGFFVGLNRLSKGRINNLNQLLASSGPV